MKEDAETTASQLQALLKNKGHPFSLATILWSRKYWDGHFGKVSFLFGSNNSENNNYNNNNNSENIIINRSSY